MSAALLPTSRDARDRVRQGAAPTTPPDVLLELAGDPDLTVRAAVAMNCAAPTQVDRLLAQDSDERVRTLLARKLSQLVPSLACGARDRLRQQALETLTLLVEDEAARVRGAITDVLKDMPNAPRALILRLAHDALLVVSEPVIRLSPLLTQDDLLALIAQAPNLATAAAVARRAGLPEAVCDAVAATADTAAITALLENPSAAIRETTLDMLIDRAADHEAWHAPLVRRPVLSPRAASALAEIVTTQLLDELTNRADLAPTIAAELRDRLALRLKPTATAAALPPDPNQALLDAQELYADDRLDEAALLAAVHRGETTITTALLAVAADVSVSVVERAASLRSAKGLVSLVWKAGFSMQVAGPVQVLLARLSPAVALRASPGGAFPLAVEEMRWQLDFLGRMGK